MKYKKAIFSFDTALFFLGQTENAPFWTHVSVPRDYKILYTEQGLIIHRKNSKYWDLGIIEVETPFGNKVKSYSYEKIVCDYISNQDDIDLEDYIKTIKNYSNYANKDFELLKHISKEMNIFDEVIKVLSLTDE